MKRLAENSGADLINIFNYTEFSMPTEYFRETTSLQRYFLSEAVAQYEKENQKRSSKILNALFGK